MPIRESDVYIKGYNDALQYFNNKQNLNNNARDAFCQAYGEIYYLSSKHPQTWRYMHNSASDMRLKNWIIAREYYKTHYNNEPLQPKDLKEVLDEVDKSMLENVNKYKYLQEEELGQQGQDDIQGEHQGRGVTYETHPQIHVLLPLEEALPQLVHQVGTHVEPAERRYQRPDRGFQRQLQIKFLACEQHAYERGRRHQPDQGIYEPGQELLLLHLLFRQHGPRFCRLGNNRNHPFYDLLIHLRPLLNSKSIYLIRKTQRKYIRSRPNASRRIRVETIRVVDAEVHAVLPFPALDRPGMFQERVDREGCRTDPTCRIAGTGLPRHPQIKVVDGLALLVFLGGPLRVVR